MRKGESPIDFGATMQERPRLNPRHSPVASPIDNSRNVILLQTLARTHVARHFRQLPRGSRRRGGSSQARREAMKLIPLFYALAAEPERDNARASGGATCRERGCLYLYT